MKKNPWYKILLSLGMLFHLTYCLAQSAFQYTSALSGISSPGFYKIMLKPSVISKCVNNLSDIRILDDQGKQVPYILKSDQPIFTEKNFIELPILSVNKEADKQTHIVIKNEPEKTIHELLLVIKNTDAERTVTLSGSDNQKQWFVIKEHLSLNNLLSQDVDRFIQYISFPNSSYKFFELVINGRDLLPVNIVKAGIYQGQLREGSYENIPDPVMLQKDSADKSTYINVSFKENYLVNKLALEITGPKFYRRTLLIRNNASDDRFNFGEYIISSDVDHNYPVSAKTKSLLLVIENQDNQPLKIRAVKAYQLNKYLLSYLESGRDYKLVFGDSTAEAPKYDLEFFKDSINNTSAEITIGSIIKNPSNKPGDTSKKNSNMIFLWIIIAIVLALLLTLTLRMTKEVSVNDTKNKV